MKERALNKKMPGEVFFARVVGPINAGVGAMRAVLGTIAFDNGGYWRYCGGRRKQTIFGNGPF